MIIASIDVRGAVRDAENFLKQHVFAMELAINRTQEERQRAMQDRAERVLTIRQPSTRRLMRRAIRYGREDRADRKAGRLQGVIRIVGGSVAPTTDVIGRMGGILLRHDDGGAQTSSALYRTQDSQFTVGGFVIPAPGLRTESKGVPRNLYPAAIGLSARSLKYEESDDPQRQYKGGRKKPTKKGKVRGFKKGTRFYFVKEGVGIFVREQLGKRSEYDAVWFFRRSITLEPRLQLVSTYEDGLEAQFQANYVGFLDFALRTAK